MLSGVIKMFRQRHSIAVFEKDGSLAKEIIEAANVTKRLGKCDYLLAYIVTIIGVTSSIVAAILAALGQDVVAKWVTAAIAAIPTFVIAVDRTFRFEERGIWHYRSTKRFEALIRQLRYEGVDVSAVSKEFSRVDLETFDGWIDFSNLSAERRREESKGNGKETGGGSTAN